MLNLTLAELERGPQRVRGEVPADDPLWDGLEATLLEPLRVEAEARSVGEGVLVRGRIGGRLRLPCRRCLEPVDLPLDEEIDLYFEPVRDDEDAAELDGEVYPLPDGAAEVDLRPALREQVLLRVPAHAVCREDCRGLCPRCGIDRNVGTCECEPEEGPSPWDALKSLKFD